jgi:hypothetical protein
MVLRSGYRVCSQGRLPRPALGDVIDPVEERGWGLTVGYGKQRLSPKIRIDRKEWADNVFRRSSVGWLKAAARALERRIRGALWLNIERLRWHCQSKILAWRLAAA